MYTHCYWHFCKISLPFRGAFITSQNRLQPVKCPEPQVDRNGCGPLSGLENWRRSREFHPESIHFFSASRNFLLLASKWITDLFTHSGIRSWDGRLRVEWRGPKSNERLVQRVTAVSFLLFTIRCQWPLRELQDAITIQFSRLWFSPLSISCTAIIPYHFPAETSREFKPPIRKKNLWRENREERFFSTPTCASPFQDNHRLRVSNPEKNMADLKEFQLVTVIL